MAVVEAVLAVAVPAVEVGVEEKVLVVAVVAVVVVVVLAAAAAAAAAEAVVAVVAAQIRGSGRRSSRSTESSSSSSQRGRSSSRGCGSSFNSRFAHGVFANACFFEVLLLLVDSALAVTPFSHDFMDSGAFCVSCVHAVAPFSHNSFKDSGPAALEFPRVQAGGQP